MKSLLPWLCALALLGGAVLLFFSNQKLTQEVTALREENKQAQTLRTELEQLKTTGSPAQAEQIAQLQKDNQELLKLRNEVRQLRDEKKQLAQQAQTAQAQVQNAQAQAQAAQANVQSLTTNLQAAQLAQAEAERQRLFRERYGLGATGPTGAVPQQMLTCINQLRQLDGAKQQWALENRKTTSDVPTERDLAQYLKNGVPKCPAGGTYALNAVSALPTCTINGHAIPKSP